VALQVPRPPLHAVTPPRRPPTTGRARAPAGKKKERRLRRARAPLPPTYVLAVPGDSDRHGGDGLTPGHAHVVGYRGRRRAWPACMCGRGRCCRRALATGVRVDVVRAAEPAGALNSTC
jgi:hypothetical protein